jgi:molybdenum cofactor cytidylyltransferase
MGCLLKQGGGLYPRLRIGAVVVAAQPAPRMQGALPALIRLQGTPLVRRHLVALSGAGVDEVVVVTGHQARAIEEQVAGFAVRVAHDADYSRGFEHSLQIGLAALEGPFDAVFALPVELALIGANDLVELIGAFKKRPGGHAIVPVVGGCRGHAMLLDALAREQMLSGTWDESALHACESANTRLVTSLDTLDDVQALARRTGWRLELPEMEAAV